MNFPTYIQEFFSKRKINNDVLQRFGVSWDGHKIIYPVLNEGGQQIFSVYRRDPRKTAGIKYWYMKGAKVSLYGIDKIKNEKSILICEGPNDCLAAWSQGIPAVTSTGGALSFQKEWAKYFEGKDVTIIFDCDVAGGKGAVKTLEIIPWAKIGTLPDERLKDICDFTTAGGKLSDVMSKALHYSDVEEVKCDLLFKHAKFMPIFFHEEYIKRHIEITKVITPRERDPKIKDKLTRAKAYPIDSMLKFNHSGSTTCLWHSETEPSLHLYKDQNKCWCFGGCGRGYDAIDVYQKLHNCSFIEAVEALQ